MSGEELQPSQYEGCSHLAELDERKKDAIVGKYKTVVSWYTSRLHEAAHHQAKRRKVRFFDFCTEKSSLTDGS